MLKLEKPIAFSSQKLTESQIHAWSITEKEAYAVIHAPQKFSDWILFSKVSIYSDHNPLAYITESAPKSPRLTRWALSLQELNITFFYRPAHLNFPAYCISRLGPEDEVIGATESGNLLHPYSSCILLIHLSFLLLILFVEEHIACCKTTVVLPAVSQPQITVVVITVTN
jgi:RNase H-like domain found in reverse transcriptase